MEIVNRNTGLYANDERREYFIIGRGSSDVQIVVAGPFDTTLEAQAVMAQIEEGN